MYSLNIRAIVSKLLTEEINYFYTLKEVNSGLIHFLLQSIKDIQVQIYNYLIHRIYSYYPVQNKCCIPNSELPPLYFYLASYSDHTLNL